jgi:hypothetical protein
MKVQPKRVAQIGKIKKLLWLGKQGSPVYVDEREVIVESAGRLPCPCGLRCAGAIGLRLGAFGAWSCLLCCGKAARYCDE